MSEGRTSRQWGVDAVIGVAARSVRTAASVVAGGERVVRAVGETTVGRVAGGAARRVVEPLARDGEEVRHQIEEQLPEAARDLSARVAPAVVETLDPAGLVSSIDLDRLMESIDVDALLRHVDVDAIISRVDVDAIIRRVDVDGIIRRVDVDGIVHRVDLDALLHRVDLDAVVGGIDLDALLEKVDLDAILARIDLNALLETVDIDTLVERTELGGLIARSTGGLATTALDAVRRQGVGLDNFVARWVDRLLRRTPGSSPVGPPLLVGPDRGLPPGPAAGPATGEAA